MGADQVLVKTTEYETGKGVWKVYQKGDEILIADPEGRCRHRSRGHSLTAVYLAGMIAEKPFISHPNADESLKYSTEQFLKGSSNEA